MMSRGALFFALFCLIFTEMLMIQVMADESELDPSTMVEDKPHTAAAEPPAVGGEEEFEAAEAPVNRRIGKHKSSDKSVAGGGVIIGGLVTAIFAAIFCYIRVTRKRAGSH